MKKFNPNQCAKCGGLKLITKDKSPFCSKCMQILKNEFARLRPDMAKKGDLVFVSDAVEK